MDDYWTFLQAKRHEGAKHGFAPTFMPDALFDFQRDLVDWSVRKGRAAMFADCGLGKTPIQLTWAENVHRHTNKPILILTPLAVAAQTIREAEKFGIEATRGTGERIVVTNYERLHHYDPNKYAGIVLDESSILKSFDGARRNDITQFMRKIPYRLLATATAAPNDYIELGTSSEALGEMGHMDMLNRFFKNDQNNSATKRMYGQAPKWRFKGHAQQPFWRWVTSWARAVRKPSDLGYDDGPFILPPIHERETVVKDVPPPEGMLFTVPAGTLAEQRAETKRTLEDRVGRVVELASHDQPALIWCHTNAESDMLARQLPGAVEVAGRHADEEKEERLLAFADGEARALVTKPTIGAWGLNFQHCNHVTYFPSHSYEAYYQAIRRCWRFGQEREVTVDLVLTKGEERVMANLRRKSEAADVMFDNLVREMHQGESINTYRVFAEEEDIPAWL